MLTTQRGAYYATSADLTVPWTIYTLPAPRPSLAEAQREAESFSNYCRRHPRVRFMRATVSRSWGIHLYSDDMGGAMAYHNCRIGLDEAITNVTAEVLEEAGFGKAADLLKNGLARAESAELRR